MPDAADEGFAVPAASAGEALRVSPRATAAARLPAARCKKDPAMGREPIENGRRVMDTPGLIFPPMN
ncbi:hypothetical protein Psi01_18480 [Planobispora siamensis]|uniref:Uncharacterized protein n=1 Tax=Planobispora siamensis TaxID=936338 RepID=A0A8J3WJ32_9ACTN|nr:hypothetical protein Psi01_18480 [Planobispora siamensis]